MLKNELIGMMAQLTRRIEFGEIHRKPADFSNDRHIIKALRDVVHDLPAGYGQQTFRWTTLYRPSGGTAWLLSESRFETKQAACQDEVAAITQYGLGNVFAVELPEGMN